MNPVIDEFKKNLEQAIEENHQAIDEAKENLQELNAAISFLESK